MWPINRLTSADLVRIENQESRDAMPFGVASSIKYGNGTELRLTRQSLLSMYCMRSGQQRNNDRSPGPSQSSFEHERGHNVHGAKLKSADPIGNRRHPAFDFVRSANPGKCIYRGDILELGVNNNNGISPCQQLTCHKDGSILIEGCGKLRIENCNRGERISPGEPFPECCKLRYKCKEIGVAPYYIERNAAEKV